MQAETTPFILDCGHVVCVQCVTAHPPTTPTGLNCPCCGALSHPTLMFSASTADDIAFLFNSTQKARYTELLKGAAQSSQPPPPPPTDGSDYGPPTTPPPTQSSGRIVVNPSLLNKARNVPPAVPPPAMMAVQSMPYSVPVPAPPQSPTTTTTTTTTTTSDDLEAELQQGTLDPKMLCAEHDMELTHYCREDRALECEVCMRRCNQGGHRLVAVAQTGAAIQAMLEDVEQMGQKIEQTTRALEESEVGAKRLAE